MKHPKKGLPDITSRPPAPHMDSPNPGSVVLEKLLDAHAEVYARTTMQYIQGEITEEERDKEWHHSDLKTKHAFAAHTQPKAGTRKILERIKSRGHSGGNWEQLIETELEGL